MERKKCPYCGEEISTSAKKCRFCGEWLTPENTVQVTPAHQSEAPYSDLTSEDTTEQPSYSSDPDPKSFFEAYLLDSFIKPYKNFSGYTSRKEFWLTYLAFSIISIGVGGLALLISGTAGSVGMIIGLILISIFGLCTIVPGLAISCRRIRDAGLNPWFILVSLVPGIGALILLILLCRPSKYQYNDQLTRFKLSDFIVVGISAVLLVCGIWVDLNTPDLYDEDYTYSNWKDDMGADRNTDAVEEVEYTETDSGDAVEVAEAYSYNNKNHRYIANVDESLLDIVLDPEYVLKGGARLELLKIGNNYNRVFDETGSTHKPLTATGAISNHNVSLKCWLTEDGEIHGRYRHDNGTTLDVNGYIAADGSLYIQLGHDSEKSEWRLYPVSDEASGTYRYEGTWGKRNLESYLVFCEDY